MAKILPAKPTPRELGYRWPAEWEPHVATWLSWPREEGISFPDAYEEVMPAFVQMARAIAQSEEVRINVGDAGREAKVRALFKGELPERVKFFHIPNEEPWCRDHGPIFVVNPKTKKKLILDWGYNAWGGKYPPFVLDDANPLRVAETFDLEVIQPGMILEGGSIEGNGAGTILTTENCLLNPNRNPSLSKEQIEQRLKDYLNVEQILWLGDGIEGDDTDGHIDDITRFVNRDTVITMVEEDPADPNYEPLRANLDRLRTMKLFDGTPLNVVPMVMPNRIDREDMRLPASYANFYIANDAVLLPVFGDPNDGRAINVLERLFSPRRIIPINTRSLIWGLGAFHCLTQQEPG